MGSFRQVATERNLEDTYYPVVLVYLEGDTDKKIFADLWFFEDGDALRFEASGGGTRVIRRVGEERANQRIAFGLVDRDTLLRESQDALFWESDDVRFKAARSFGQWIRVMRKWEIENYLLDPGALEEELADREGRTSIRDKQDVSRELLDHAPHLSHLSAAVILLNQNGVSLHGDQDQNPNLGSLRAKLINKLASAGISDVTCFDQMINDISAFGTSALGTPEEEWNGLTRVIDGKRALRRLKMIDRPGSGEDRHIALARKLARRVDPELQSYVSEFRAAASAL